MTTQDKIVYAVLAVVGLFGIGLLISVYVSAWRRAARSAGESR